MKYLYLALSSIILAYIIIVLLYIYIKENYYITQVKIITREMKFNLNYKEVFIEVDKDIKLKSWFLKKDLSKKNKTILYFHGNAGDFLNRVHKLNELK